TLLRRRDADTARMLGPGLFGIALIVLSFVAPDSIGEGGYIPIRLRFLGTLALLPAIAEVLRRLRPRTAGVVCAALISAFAVRTFWIVRDARAVHDDRVAVSALVAEADRKSTRLNSSHLGI